MRIINETQVNQMMKSKGRQKIKLGLVGYIKYFIFQFITRVDVILF